MDNDSQQMVGNQQDVDGIIPNKVAAANLINISIESFYPKGERKHLDIAQWLYEGLILREKDFRQSIKTHDWEQYRDCYVWIDCSEDAIIPQWAYLLLGVSLRPFAKKVVFGSAEQLDSILMDEVITKTDLSQYKDQRVILNGCADLPIPPHAYLILSHKLSAEVKSLMFGEACSTVPVFKKK